LVFDAENIEIATLFFEDILFPNTGNKKIKKIIVSMDPEKSA